MNVSVVTPVYEDPRIGRALESVRDQSFPGELEQIVVDGGSTGETVGVLEEYEHSIDVLISEPDEGVYDAMNKGIEAASGEVVAILNADDRWQDYEVLADVVDAFERHDADAVYGDKALVDEEDRVRRYWIGGRHEPWRWHLGWMPPHPTFFVRREVYERFGVFKLEYRYSADYEFMLRTIRKHGIGVAYVPRVLTRFELGGQSNASVGDVVAANREVYRAWRENELPGGVIVPFFKLGRRLFQYLRAIPYRKVGPGADQSERFRKGTPAE